MLSLQFVCVVENSLSALNGTLFNLRTVKRVPSNRCIGTNFVYFVLNLQI